MEKNIVNHRFGWLRTIRETQTTVGSMDDVTKTTCSHVNLAQNNYGPPISVCLPRRRYSRTVEDDWSMMTQEQVNRVCLSYLGHGRFHI